MHRTTTPTPSPRSVRPPVRLSGGLVAVGVLAAPLAVAAPALATTAGPTGPCPDDDGVTVVVDATALGGEVAVGCAPGDPASGTEALLAAGFTETRAESGFICAVDGLPDPCPTEFTGEFWAYFSGEPDGEWVSYEVGSDDADPSPGSVEGWVWSDGAPPSVAPPAPDGATTGSDSTAGETDGATEDAATEDAATADAATDVEDEEGSSTTPLLVALAAVALVGGAGLVAARRRRDPNGPAGQH